MVAYVSVFEFYFLYRQPLRLCLCNLIHHWRSLTCHLRAECGWYREDRDGENTGVSCRSAWVFSRFVPDLFMVTTSDSTIM